MATSPKQNTLEAMFHPIDDSPTENSPGFREDADNVSTTSSMETEWIEVDQPDGKFYFNRYTKEVRKELPTGR